jgi:hypothetical protein
MAGSRIGTHEEWAAAREELLAREKEYTRQRHGDLVAPPRRVRQPVSQEPRTRAASAACSRGIPMLLLHHAGAKSGQRRINPLAYLITRPLTNDQRANRDSHDPRIGQAQAAGS